MLKKFLLNLLFPAVCLGCGQEGGHFCAACFKKLKFSGQEKSGHLVCPDLAAIFIAGDYDDPLLAAAIKKFKYDFLSALGEPLGRWLAMFWAGQINLQPLAGILNRPEATPLVIPIPLSRRRARWRGFNQAEILAREISTRFGYEMSLDLKRVKHRQPQAELGGRARQENVRDIFSWNGKNPNGQGIEGRTIVLIDDVITTGATLNEAARVLKAAGAERVYGLVLAKG